MNVWGVEIYYPNTIVNVIKTPTWYASAHILVARMCAMLASRLTLDPVHTTQASAAIEDRRRADDVPADAHVHLPGAAA
jgi:hypothetical protein